MALLTVVLVLGSLLRLLVLLQRPTAAERFRQVRRRLLATRVEQAGDLLALATAIWMIFFGYGRRPGSGLLALWGFLLVISFGCVLLAHAAARRYRSDRRDAPRAPASAHAIESDRPPAEGRPTR